MAQHIRISVSRGHRYRQLVTSVWDPVKKRSVAKVLKHLGPVDDLEKENPAIPLHIDGIESSCAAGHLALFYSIAQQYRLPECLENVCPSEDGRDANALMALVFNQLNGRRPLKDIGQWLVDTPLGKWMDIDGQDFTKDNLTSALDAVSRTDNEITVRKAFAIQKRVTDSWREQVGRDPPHYYFYYDIARIKYNGSHCEWADNGYGPIANGRPHIGFGLVTSRGNHFPVLSLTVNGATNDARTFEAMADSLKAWQLKKITLILDRGIMNAKSTKFALNAGFHVLGGCNENSNDVKAAIRQWKDDSIELSTQVYPRPGNGEIYHRAWDGDLFGQHGRFVLILDPARRTKERGARDRMLHELRHSAKPGRVSELRHELGNVVAASVGRRGWQIDETAETEAKKADGRFLLFTTDLTLKPEETVRAYHQRDEIEKAFRELNGRSSMGPIRYRVPNHVEPYLTVVCHLAYLIRTAINWSLRTEKREESIDQTVDELKKIYEVRLTRKGVSFPRWTRLSEQQRELVNLFDLKGLIHSN